MGWLELVVVLRVIGCRLFEYWLGIVGNVIVWVVLVRLFIIVEVVIKIGWFVFWKFVLLGCWVMMNGFYGWFCLIIVL